MPEKNNKNTAQLCWTDQSALLRQLQGLWDRGLILQAVIQQTDLFPRRLTFKTPDSKALSNEFTRVRQWLNELSKLRGFRLVSKTIKHRIIGENRLPCEAWIDDLDTAVHLLKRHKELAVFSRLLSQSKQRAPQLLDWIAQYPLKALSLAEDWERLLDFVVWRQQHPSPGIYLREVSLPGIDTRFIEQHRSVLTALLNASLPAAQINTRYQGARQFAQRFGFLKKPSRVRFRLFEPELANTLFKQVGSDMDISLTARDFSLLEQCKPFMAQIRRVFITENEINFLSFPPQQQSLIIFGSGYGFDALAEAKWLADKEVIYWGDIDTHGFAILDQLRSQFPHVHSFLMDEATLLAFAVVWGSESKPEKRPLSRLTPAEQKLYQALVDNQYGNNLRLEQERVDYDYVNQRLREMITCS